MTWAYERPPCSSAASARSPKSRWCVCDWAARLLHLTSLQPRPAFQWTEWKSPPLWSAHAPHVHAWLRSNKLVAFHRLIYPPAFAVTFVRYMACTQIPPAGPSSLPPSHAGEMYINIVIICDFMELPFFVFFFLHFAGNMVYR